MIKFSSIISARLFQKTKLLFVVTLCGGLLTGAAEAREGANISTLGDIPDWSVLKSYDNKVHENNFMHRLKHVYDVSAGEAVRIFFRDDNNALSVRADGGKYLKVNFQKSGATQAGLRYWRRAEEWVTATSDSKPLNGLRVVVDPGHIGGKWARMEERFFMVPGARASVQEGDMTLAVAGIIAKKLGELGAKVRLTRYKLSPVTKSRPKDFIKLAKKLVSKSNTKSIWNRTPVETEGGEEKWDSEFFAEAEAVRKKSELLFYRTSEIKSRAKLVNEAFRPDLVLCLHFNAEAWDGEGLGNHSPVAPRLVDANHFHVLMNGCYSFSELSKDDIRFDMTRRLIEGIDIEELRLADVVSRVFAKKTGLKPYIYKPTPKVAKRVNDNPYLWARNLAANRQFRCPVVYMEPYVMNSHEVHQRVQMGYYAGKKIINGKPRINIYDEYADGITSGLVEYSNIMRRLIKDKNSGNN